MKHVITAERADREGATPEQILMVADWHDGIINDIRHDLKMNKKKPRHGGKPSMARHEAIAAELRRVADELRALQTRAAA